MATYTGTKHIPNDTVIDALFAVHCLGAEEITREGEATRWKLHGKTRWDNYLPVWHFSPERIMEFYDLVHVSITQSPGSWTFVKDAVLIHTHFSEYDQTGWIKECHHARSKKAALAHGLLLIALTLQGVDVTRRE